LVVTTFPGLHPLRGGAGGGVFSCFGSPGNTRRGGAGLLFGNHIVDASVSCFFVPSPGVNVF
jgi:hypothetical protein